MPTIQFQDANNTKINFDGNPSQEDIEEAYSKVTGNQQQPSQDSGESNFQNLSSQEDAIGKNMIGGNPEQPQQKMDEGQVLSSLPAQAGKAIVGNPLVSGLDNMMGGAAQKWADTIPSPQGVQQNIAAGIGSAVPLVLSTLPIMRATEAATGGIAALAKGVPILGRATQIFKDSTIAKGYVTGLGYGAAEAEAMKAQGQDVDVVKHANETGAQFALWGAASRLGATGVSKVLSRLPNQVNAQALLSKVPIVGESLKKAYTPEGLGSIAGGMVMGSLNAPDQQKGIAGAMVGGAMSALNPSEKYQFQTGMGKTMGYSGISAITDHWGKGFEKANDVFEKEGFDNVVKSASNVTQTKDAQGNVMNMAVPQQVEAIHKQALGEVKNELSQEYDQALMNNENINPKSMNSFLSLLRQRVNGLQDPLSPVSKLFNRVYSSLQGDSPSLQQSGTITQQDLMNMANRGRLSASTTQVKGVNQNADMNITARNPKELSEQQQAQQKNQSSMTLNGLHQLKTAMQDMVSPAAYAGKEPFSVDERDASGIAKQISKYISSQNQDYSEVNKKYARFKDVEGLAYDLDAKKLSQNRFNMSEVDGNQRDYDLDKVSNYLKSQGKGEYDSRRLLNKYYAYDVYKNPTQFAMNKTMPIRVAMSAGIGGVAQLTGIPGAGPAAALAAWHYGSPEAWLPLLKGADIGKNSD